MLHRQNRAFQDSLSRGARAGALEQLRHPLGLLLVRAVVEHEQQADVVADDRRLVLQVVEQAQALRGEVRQVVPWRLGRGPEGGEPARQTPRTDSSQTGVCFEMW